MTDPAILQGPALSQSQPQALVLGLGLSGLALARWCARQGWAVTVADTREAPPGLDALRRELPAARFVAGPLDAALARGKACVWRSPGLSPAQFGPIFDTARADGARVGAELDLFSAELSRLAAERDYRPRVLAVTGTNGKTTVTVLTGRLLERAGLDVAVAGNIGPTLLDTLAARLDAGRLPAVWVLELSSFQLHGVEGFGPTAATVLNLSEDHLDWHGDMAAYAAAKARVFGPGTRAVLNRDDAAVLALLSASPAAGRGRVPPGRPVVTFGADAPRRPGDWGLETSHGMTWLVRAQGEVALRPRRGSDTAIEVPPTLQRLMPADALRIAGRHNALNALAALALAEAAGAPLAPMLHALREYRGEPHRCEPVAVVSEVEYIDDSKGTNVGATVAAMSGLGAQRRLVLILGGDGKGQDFAPLAGPLARHARAAVLIGRDAARLRAALDASGVPLVDAADMGAAVRAAAAAARPGDAVLLSPACASLDMFDNYRHRGQCFREAVAALARDVGQEPSA